MGVSNKRLEFVEAQASPTLLNAHSTIELASNACAVTGVDDIGSSNHIDS